VQHTTHKTVDFRLQAHGKQSLSELSTLHSLSRNDDRVSVEQVAKDQKVESAFRLERLAFATY
jgi:hypothetical protein